MTTLRGGDTNPRAEGTHSKATSMSSALASSPTLHGDYDFTGSSDIVSEGPDEEAWEGFDGPAAGGIMSEYQDPTGHGFVIGGKPAHMIVMSNGVIYTGLNDDMNDSYSSAAMSIRAEQILANAKKRLTVSCCELMNQY